MPVSLALSVVMLVAAPRNSEAGLLASCAWVRAENEGAGSGFVVDTEKKLLVTCRHIVADRKKVDVIFPWVHDGEVLTDRATYLRNRNHLAELGLLVTGKVLKVSDDQDLALVELESLPPGTKAVTFALHPPKPGELLRVVGNRLDLDTVWNITTGPARTAGHLADGYFWRGKKLAANAEVILGQFPTEEGDSGGPVFNASGELIGMASALRRQCPLAAVCISASEIKKVAGLSASLPPKEKPRNAIADTLTRATVWVQPTATDRQLAGVLVEPDLVLTVGKGLLPGNRVGVAFPVREGEKWIGERGVYRDPLALQLRGAWRSARVIANDSNRDLALLKLDSPVEFMQPVVFAKQLPLAGDSIHTMSHPGGLEFAWVYAGGTVRQRGAVSIALGENAKRIDSLVCQVPAQMGSPGGPVLNDRGELVGVMSARESAQMVGYAVTTEELAAFLDIARLNQPARTLAGLLARVDALPRDLSVAIAIGFAHLAEECVRQGQLDNAYQNYLHAVALDPGCLPARMCRAKMLEAATQPAEALAELDAAVEKGPFDRGVLLFRAELAGRAKDWRKARGDLERLLDVNPTDAEARQRLIGVLIELGEDAKAATAVSDTLRADPKRLPGIARDLLSQADLLAKKYPDAPAIPAGWLQKAMTAAKREEFATCLKQAGEAKDDAERLAILRTGLQKIK
jgi:S1-C subfamily serine protease